MAKKLTKAKAREILHDKEVHGHPLTDKQRRFFGAVSSGYIKAQNGIEGTMGGLTDKGFNFNPAWGGAWKNGGWLEKYADGGILQPPMAGANQTVPMAQFGLTYLEPNSYKLPKVGPSSELAMSVGGENGEPAYLIPSMKYGRMQVDPMFEFKRTGEHLGGPFKTWQEADAWERDVRHPYVERGESIPTPYRRWGQFAMGGSLPGSVGFTYARVAGAAPSEGPRAKKTLPSAQNGMEMKFYQQGLDFKPKTISKNGGWLDKFDDGGEIVQDDEGYWNPQNWGKPVEINSNQITMEGVLEPLLGISDTGDTQMMYPDKNYTFEGTKVVEYPREYFTASDILNSDIPVAQGGRQVSSRTSGPRLPLSPAVPTRSDSIILSRNAALKNAFYQNNPKYNKSESLVNFKDPNLLRQLVKATLETRRMYSSFDDSHVLPVANPEGFKITGGDIKRRVGKVAGSSDVYSAPDIINSNDTDTYFNPASPPIFFSPSILPQGSVKYYSTYYGDIAESPYYDPIAVTPWDMLTPQQQQVRLKKYGTSGTPYINPPKQSTTSSKKTTTQQKPKLVTPVKKETPKAQTKKEQPPVQTTTPTTTTKAPIKSVTQTTGLPDMFRNPKAELLVDDFGNYEWFRTDDDSGDLKPIRRATREEIEYSKKQKQRNGGVSVNKADEHPLEKLDNLFNFTNYNKPTAKNGKWLDKYK